jgi:hypothetical protein
MPKMSKAQEILTQLRELDFSAGVADLSDPQVRKFRKLWQALDRELSNDGEFPVDWVTKENQQRV